MADFTGVIRRAVEGLANNTPEARQKVYDRARQTIQRQLDAMPNSSSSAIFERQLSSVEEAIKEIEAQYADGAAPDAGAATPPPVAPTPAAPTPEAPTPVTPTPAKPVEPVSKPAEAVVEKKEEPKPVEPVVSKPLEVETKPTEPETKPVEEPAVVPAATEPSTSDKPEDNIKAATEVPEDVSTNTDEAETATPIESEPEVVAEEVVAEEPVAPAPVAEDVVAPVENSAPAANAIDDELAIPAVDNKVEAASNVDDKVSEIVDDVTSKIEADKSGKAMPKADSSFLTDDSIIDQAVGEIKSSLQADPDSVNPDFPDHDSAFGFGAEALPEATEPKRRKSPIVMIVAAVLLVLAGSAYGVWRYGGEIFGSDETQVAEVVDTTSEPETNTATEEPTEEREVVTKVEDTTPTTTDSAPVGESEKFTQRLNADGTEVDPGPSPELINGLPGEEGRSVASQSDGQTTAPVETAQDDTAPVADGTPAIEKMLFYETSLGLEQQARYEGGVTWTEEIESDGTASRPFIKAQIQVPERNLSIDMSIKLNGDQTLPVSHLVDINFSLPDDFEGGEIDQVTEVKMKNTEEQPGDRLAAISAKIDTTFFVVGLENDDPEVVATNLQLLSRRNWIDIPISYSNGRKALITLEKGASGVAVFDKVLAAWERNPVQ